MKSLLDIGNLGKGSNKLKGWIFVNYVLIEGLSNRLGVHSYVTHCKKWTNHAKIRGIFKALTSLDRVKANQNGSFVYFGGK